MVIGQMVIGHFHRQPPRSYVATNLMELCCWIIVGPTSSGPCWSGDSAGLGSHGAYTGNWHDGAPGLILNPES